MYRVVRVCTEIFELSSTIWCVIPFPFLMARINNVNGCLSGNPELLTAPVLVPRTSSGAIFWLKSGNLKLFLTPANLG